MKTILINIIWGAVFGFVLSDGIFFIFTGKSILFGILNQYE